MTDRLHSLHSDAEPPARFTFPFNYTPHPLTVTATRLVAEYITSRSDWKEELAQGKMFGVLVARAADGTVGFLAAYSGLLAGRNDWQFFVPPVFDAQDPDGHFKTEERRISAINREIGELRNGDEYRLAKELLDKAANAAKEKTAAFKRRIDKAKAERDQRRRLMDTVGEEERLRMERESQFMKAEFRRIKKACENEITEARRHTEAIEEGIGKLRQRRTAMSEELQKWLFRQYVVGNAKGERRTVADIFADTPRRYPPAGAGDCCAPKLLEYAYRNQLHPLCMAEFWWGQSPKAEVRHHLHFYPACNSKCKPILGFMLQGLDVDPNPHDSLNGCGNPAVIYEDEWIVAVNKPSGMPSVPGKIDRESAEEFLAKGHGAFRKAAHRLDMDTSGILIVAKDSTTLQMLHREFARREVKKTYYAILDGSVSCPKSGMIELPLAPDPTDRPRQIVDREHGKPSATSYEIVCEAGDRTVVRLTPLTGHTHQLRVHCAHADGLATPILGDTLYGHPADCRMMLHAAELSFPHPHTGKTVTLRAEWEDATEPWSACRRNGNGNTIE